LSEDGDIEFWQDGTTTKRLKAQQEDLKATLKRGWVPVELSPENQPEQDSKSATEIVPENQPETQHTSKPASVIGAQAEKIE